MSAPPDRMFAYEIGQSQLHHMALVAAGVVMVVLAAVGGLGSQMQLGLLDNAVARVGNEEMAFHLATMSEGLKRLIIVDRLVPSITGLLTVALSVWLVRAEIGLSSPWPDVVAVSALALSPVVLQKVGELAVMAMSLRASLTVGEVVELPLVVLNWPFTVAGWELPGWGTALLRRLNPFTVSVAVLAALLLKALCGDRRTLPYLGLSLTALAAAAFATWVLGPVAVDVVLRGV